MAVRLRLRRRQSRTAAGDCQDGGRFVTARSDIALLMEAAATRTEGLRAAVGGGRLTPRRVTAHLWGPAARTGDDYRSRATVHVATY